MLRSIFVFLVCLHVGTASWWLFHRENRPNMLPAQEKNTPYLSLLSEVERSQNSGSEELNAAPQSLSATPLCLSIGAFDTPADLRAAMNVLTPIAGRIQFREMQAAALQGYRVYLPAAQNREEALQFARQLAANGLRDYYVVTAGAQENTVSLGIFRDLKNAELRKEAVTKLGFNPVLESRTEQASQWWIDVALPEDFKLESILPNTKLSANKVTCQ
jgi:hypothetical protein